MDKRERKTEAIDSPYAFAPGDAFAGMLAAWRVGDRRHAGLLARALLRDLHPHTRRVWLADAVAVARATRDEFPGETEGVWLGNGELDS